ncbi:MAG: UvrD-helicase domain-containing protein [Elusimicrobia bacterium]|nr:UvrD-helicase domain-containing protein [Candidatus Liberimonas magnetica]
MTNAFLEQLNKEQQDAVLHINGPLIIFAGAGTGKTRVITYRIAHMLNQGISPYHILAVTFTNKAAEEMRKRVDNLVPSLGKAVWVSTFHSFCAHFLRVEAKNIGLDPQFLIYDDTDQKNVIKKCIEELILDDKKYKPARILEIISRAKDDMLDADSFEIHAQTSADTFRQIVATVYKLYQNKLKEASALDFGDLLLSTVEALRDDERLRQKYQERFTHVLVDEYQDTNHAQYLLTKYISAKHKNLCVVGDDDQSIYSWRGADVRNILEFENDYPECKMIKLEENYRSVSNILDSAWNVIKNNEKRVDKKLWTSKKEGNDVKLYESATAIEEAQSVVSRIEYLKNNKNEKFNDFAVFYRTNAQSRVLEDAFRRAGIPYAIVGSVRFYDRQEIKDLMAYLRLLHNPNDNISFARIINVPKRGIGKTAFKSIEQASKDKGVSLWYALEHMSSIEATPSARKSILEFKEMIYQLRLSKNNLTIRQITEKIIEKTGYLKELEAEDTPEAQNRIENIYELLTAIGEFEARSPDKSLSGYLTQVSLVNDIDEWKDTFDKVTLMTLHLAKGLEFRTVFITGLEEGLVPIGESAFDMDELEEERRLMYVGMTRAKEDLYLSWAQERTVFGKTRWNMRSRFIDEAKVFIEERASMPEIKRNVSSYSPEPAPTKANSGPFQLESRVKHEKFGLGRIIDKSGSGDDLKVVVLFDTGQWKKLVVKYANLEELTD